jgi:lyso-ornithine lipid O-acyltransferase
VNKSNSHLRHVRRPWRLFLLLLHVLVGAAAAQTLLRGSRAVPPRTVRQRAVVRWWMRRLCRIVGMQVKVHGMHPDRGSLLVANHVSWLDIPAVMSTIDVDFVSKHEVQRWPVVGAMAARAGTIFIIRGGREAAAATANRMAARLQQPYNVIVFPEGTTTDGTSVRRFHARLYQAAVQTKSPVQALAIRYPGQDGPHGVVPFVGDDSLVSHLWRLLGEKRFIVELNFCKPVSPEADRRALAHHTRAQICRTLGLEIEVSRESPKRMAR